jgi:hypothetical protein
VVLITAREIDQQYEWSAHEPAGLRAGLEQPVIDAVKYDRDVTGLTEIGQRSRHTSRSVSEVEAP